MSKSLPVLDLAGQAGCCPPLAAEPLSRAQAEQVAPLLKALGDPVRGWSASRSAARRTTGCSAPTRSDVSR